MCSQTDVNFPWWCSAAHSEQPAICTTLTTTTACVHLVNEQLTGRARGAWCCPLVSHDTSSSTGPSQRTTTRRPRVPRNSFCSLWQSSAIELGDKDPTRAPADVTTHRLVQIGFYISHFKTYHSTFYSDHHGVCESVRGSM